MVACVAQQSSPSMSKIISSRKLLRASTYDSSSPVMTCRKRLLSEQNDEYDNSSSKLSHDDNDTNKKPKLESFLHDSNNDNQHRHVLSNVSYTSFEKITTPLYTDKCRISSSINQNQNIQTMLFCPQSPTIDNNENEHEVTTNFITSAQLSAYMTSINYISFEKLLIIDCGSPLRHNERRIKDSILLNINDKLSRKRLITRGLKNFLDQNFLNRLNQSEIIVLYDDTIQTTKCSDANKSFQISPILQCIFDQIKRYDSTKTIAILQSSFEEFYQYYPTFCYLSSSSTNQQLDHLTPSPTLDLESYQMSEVLPGLFLGNARDAEDINLLKENQIKSIINISTTIPCYYQKDKVFDYLQLECQDSTKENILQHFQSTFEYMNRKFQANENILVHCQGGISRSPSFIIGYLMKYHSKTFDQAYTLVKEKRKIINPNLNFLAQLTRYEQMLSTIHQ